MGDAIVGQLEPEAGATPSRRAILCLCLCLCLRLGLGLGLRLRLRLGLGLGLGTGLTGAGEGIGVVVSAVGSRGSGGIDGKVSGVRADG